LIANLHITTARYCWIKTGSYIALSDHFAPINQDLAGTSGHRIWNFMTFASQVWHNNIAYTYCLSTIDLYVTTAYAAGAA
jgi:hypothetical protein